MKFGVLGWGLRSPVAQLAHRPDLGHVLAVLADPRDYARAKFKEANPQADAVDSIEDLLSRDLDAVFVLTPDWLHEEHAIACLEAGKIIFLEKPMAVTAAGCDRILEARRRTGGRIYAGHNMRWFPVIRKMKEFIDQGAVGNVKAAWCRQYVAYGGEAYFCDWHADRKNTNGLLLQKGAHDIDILHWLCGSYSKRVVGMGGLEVYGQNQTRETFEKYENDHFRDTWPPSALDRVNPGADIEDLNMILMELQNGVKASYQQCQFSPDSWRNYTLIGDEGRIENFGDQAGDSVIRIWDNRAKGWRENGDLEYRVPAVEGAGHGGADELMIDEFMRWLSGEKEICTSPVAARMSAAAGEAGTLSVRNGSQPFDVPPLPAELADGLPTGLGPIRPV